MRFSIEVQSILRAAQEFADGAEHLHSGHLLLALVTQQSRASRVLADLRLDRVKVLDALMKLRRANRQLEESDQLFTAVQGHMADAAMRSSSNLVSSLHLLLAITREKQTIAYQLFILLGVPPVQVRTLALAGINGPVPRQIEPKPLSFSARLFGDEPASTVKLADPPKAPRVPTGPVNLPPPAPPPSSVSPAPAPASHGLQTPSGLPLAPSLAEPFAPTRAPAALSPIHPSALLTPKPPQPAEGPEASEDPGLPWLLDPETFPVLTALGRNLSVDAARGLLDPVIGRAQIIETMLDVLHKRRSNNPVLVGEPGVGKTAVVEGLALAMLERPKTEPQSERATGEPSTRRNLHEKIVVSLDVGAIVAGTELRGAFARRMAQLKDEVRAAQGRVIVFIDELHTLIGAGSGDGPLDAANDLKAALARGDFPCIGATTPSEYHRYIEKDPALERRFQPIAVEEPNEEDALAILRGVIEKYENHHEVLFEPASLEAAVRMSRRYLVERRLPDKAFNLIDTAAARVVRQGKEVVEIRDIAEVVSELTRTPIERLLLSDEKRILNLRADLAQRVIGHTEVLDALTEVIERSAAGFSSGRPIGSFLFLGPSGVGKTETAKVLAELLFGSPDAMTRIDMSEFMERHSVSRLLGASAGYVGHEEAGQLTAAMTRRPYQILLFDEIEKAHPEVLYLLLQLLDEGRLSDAKGRTLRFQNTVVIMTSNLGSEVLRQRSKRIGFSGNLSDADADATLSDSEREAVLKAAQRALPPELWGRVDEKCIFAPLSRPQLRHIVRLLIQKSSEQLKAERKVSYEASEDLIEHLVESDGLDLTLGARPLRRAVQRKCESAVARALLRGDVQGGEHLSLQWSEGEILVVPVI